MQKKKSTATLFAFLGGAFGLHKFYLRDPGSGIFYMVMTYVLMGIFGMPITVFLGFIDAFKIMSMSEEKFDEKYNNPQSRSSLRRTRGQRAPAPTQRQADQKREIELERQRNTYKRTSKRVRNNPFKKSGLKKYEDFDLEEAIKDFERALEINPDDLSIHFQMGAIYSLLEKKDKSFYHIQKAVEMGFKDTDKILTVDDFAYIRIQEEFEAFKNSGFTSTKPPAIEGPKQDLLQDDMLLSQLNKLKDLRERGLLSEKEFVYEKEKLMQR